MTVSTTKPQPPSIYDLDPIEIGGIIAREGFSFQDHVAASFCLEMLLESDIIEVWCESQDDITLIREISGQKEVEFVQVKNNDFDQLWSVAKLCSRESSEESNKTTSGERSHSAAKSIFEKSLAYDRCFEPVSFRIVTSLGVNSDLKVLTLELSSDKRKKSHQKLAELTKKINEKAANYISPNNHTCDFWVENTYWDIRHSENSLQKCNLDQLSKITESIGHILAYEQRYSIYAKILDIVREAAKLREKDKKRIVRQDFLQQISSLVQSFRYPTTATTGLRLVCKMQEAKLSDGLIQSANEARMRFLEDIRTEGYADDYVVQKKISREISGILRDLLAQLEAGKFPDDIDFHEYCYGQLKELKNTKFSSSEVPLDFYHGCMYSIVDRCQHRFKKVTKCNP